MLFYFQRFIYSIHYFYFTRRALILPLFCSFQAFIIALLIAYRIESPSVCHWLTLESFGGHQGIKNAPEKVIPSEDRMVELRAPSVAVAVALVFFCDYIIPHHFWSVNSFFDTLYIYTYKPHHFCCG